MKEFGMLKVLAALAVLTLAAFAAPLDARGAAVSVHALKELIAMNATIEYMQENGADASTLVSLRADFEGKMSLLSDYAAAGDEAGFNATLEEMHSIAREFRDAVAASSADKQRLRDRIRERLQGNASVVAKANNTAWQVAKHAALQVFDTHLASVQAFQDRTRERFAARNVSANFSETQEIIDQIASMRDDLEAAFDSGDKAEVFRVQGEIKALYAQLRGVATRNAVVFAHKVLDRASGLATRLQARGVDVSVLAGGIANLSSAVAEAENACMTSREECKDALKSLKESFKSFRSSAREAVAGSRAKNATGETDSANATGGSGKGSGTSKGPHGSQAGGIANETGASENGGNEVTHGKGRGNA